VFGHGSRQIVVPELAGNPAHGLEGVEMTANESFETLTVGELHGQLAAVTFHQAEGIELARLTTVEQGAEVSPLDFEALAGRRLQAQESAAHGRVRPQGMEIILQDGDAALEAEGAQALQDDDGAGFRVLLEQFSDGWLEGIELAGTLTANSGGCRGSQVLRQGSAADVEVTGDLAHGPVLGPVQAMNRMDLLGGQHRAIFKGARAKKPEGCSFQEARACGRGASRD